MIYRIWITITIRHNYFNSNKCGVELRPSRSTSRLFYNSGLLFRKQDINSWSLLRPIEERTKDRVEQIFLGENYNLDFDLEILSPEFEYFTEWTGISMKGDGWLIRDREEAYLKQKYLQIPVTGSLLNGNMDARIKIFGREVLWEFILIPKYTSGKACIELRENTGLLKFGVINEIDFPGEQKAFRCLSENRVPMKEGYNYKIGLWEKKEYGEWLLSDHIPFPKPGSISPERPEDMITSYFYF